MNGITILQAKEILSVHPVAIILIIVSGLVALISLIMYYLDMIQIPFIPLFSLAVIGITGICAIFIPMHTGKYVYTIQVENTVNLNEFFSKYNNIEHKYANIYTVEEIDYNDYNN